MGQEINPTQSQYKQVTVDVPEDRLAEFHHFFGLFLAGGMRRGRGGRHGRPHRGGHGRHCGGRRGETETNAEQTTGQAPETATPATETPQA